MTTTTMITITMIIPIDMGFSSLLLPTAQRQRLRASLTFAPTFLALPLNWSRRLQRAGAGCR